MKKLLLAVGVLASSVAFAQSNAPGVIQLGLGSGWTIGTADINMKSDAFEAKMNGVGVNGNYNLRAQYGLSEKFSAGIYLRREAAVYAATSADADNIGESTAVGTSGFGFGVEGKFYAVNKDKFALYFGPTIGYSTSTIVQGSSNTEGSGSGLNFSVLGGFNWWWADFIGMSLDLGYNKQMLAVTYDEEAFKDVKTDIDHGGFYFGLGLVSKFGGK